MVGLGHTGVDRNLLDIHADFFGQFSAQMVGGDLMAGTNIAHVNGLGGITALNNILIVVLSDVLGL